MFLGRATHSVDGKGRVVLPARYRGALAEGCVVVMGRSNQLEVWPEKVWEAKFKSQLPSMTGEDGERRRLHLASEASDEPLDGAGRVLLKAGLLEFAGLMKEGEAVILGNVDHLEIWNPELNAIEEPLRRATLLYPPSHEEGSIG